MESKEAILLARLLREMRERSPYYFPEEVWLELHRTVAMPYVELLIPRKNNGKWEFFLTQRAPTDSDWPSTWHVPGGFWRTDQTQQEACQSVALRELGRTLKDPQEFMTYKWTNHPRGKVISHVCICEPQQALETRPDAMFFSELPEPFIEQEIQFIEKGLRHLKNTYGTIE